MILRSFSVFGAKYKISQEKCPTFNGEEVDGLCDFINKKIILRRGQADREKLETLFHELFHAALKETGISLILHHKIEEMIVDNLSRLVVNYIMAITAKELDKN